MPAAAASAAEPKYREMERRLRQEIEAGVWLPGDRIPAEHELSQRFGVAYMTARQAVGNLVSDRILQRIPGKGTFVLESKEASIGPAVAPLAMLVPALWERLDPYYFPDILGSFEAHLKAAGRPVAIQDYAAAERDDRLTDDTVVACLILGRQETELIERVRDRGLRVLAVNRYPGRRVIPEVAADNAGGVEQAVDHLVALGHRDIAFLRGVPDNLDAADRRRGFRAAMRRHGLPPDREAGDGFREQCGYDAARALLRARSERPTALVCASDLSAVGAIKAASEMGLSVPGDLSVVGFGDFSVAAYLHPGLTTVQQPRCELGAAAARLLLRLAAGEELGKEKELLPTHFVERGTTAPPAVRRS